MKNLFVIFLLAISTSVSAVVPQKTVFQVME